jgi:hypothetical protein
MQNYEDEGIKMYYQGRAFPNFHLGCHGVAV